MPLQIPSPSEAWEKLTPRQKRVAGWILLVFLPVAILLGLATHYDQTIDKLIDRFWQQQPAIELRVVQLTPFEYTQQLEDRIHAGEGCMIDWDESDDGIACRFPDGCILAKHYVGGVTSRVWKLHPSRYGPPPTDDVHDHAATVSGAGLMGGRQQGKCWPDPSTHPGLWQAESSELTSSPCSPDGRYVWEFHFGHYFNPAGYYVDGCVLRVPYNPCGGYYDYSQAAWVECWH